MSTAASCKWCCAHCCRPEPPCHRSDTRNVCSLESIDGPAASQHLEELEAQQASKPPAIVAISEAEAEQKKPARRSLPETLPREVQLHMPKQAARPDCGGKLDPLGEDVSEKLEYVPAHFKVIRTFRPKLTCRCCRNIVQEPAPSSPIEKGLTGPGFLFLDRGSPHRC